MLYENVYLICSSVSTPTPNPTDNPYPYLNDATAGTGGSQDYGLLGDVGSMVANGIVDGFVSLYKLIVTNVMPYAIVGCKAIVLCSAIVYFCTKDIKYLSTAVKWAIYLLIFMFLYKAAL